MKTIHQWFSFCGCKDKISGGAAGNSNLYSNSDFYGSRGRYPYEYQNVNQHQHQHQNQNHPSGNMNIGGQMAMMQGGGFHDDYSKGMMVPRTVNNYVPPSYGGNR